MLFSWLRRAARPAVGFAVVLGALEGVVRLIGPTGLPAPSAVLAELPGLLGDAAFGRHLVSTVLTWSLGLLLAVVAGVGLGVLLGSSPVARLAGAPVVELLRPVPAIALVPLAVLALGQGRDTLVLLVAWAAVWPVLLATAAGARTTDPRWVDVGRTAGLRPALLLTRVRLPAVLPSVLLGVRLAGGIALVVTVAVELVGGAGQGLGGYVLRTGAGGGRLATTYAVTVVAGALGAGFDSGMRRLRTQAGGL